jgi:hypothetical protein
MRSNACAATRARDLAATAVTDDSKRVPTRRVAGIAINLLPARAAETAGTCPGFVRTSDGCPRSGPNPDKITLPGC